MDDFDLWLELYCKIVESLNVFILQLHRYNAFLEFSDTEVHFKHNISQC